MLHFVFFFATQNRLSRSFAVTTFVCKAQTWTTLLVILLLLLLYLWQNIEIQFSVEALSNQLWAMSVRINQIFVVFPCFGPKYALKFVGEMSGVEWSKTIRGSTSERWSKRRQDLMTEICCWCKNLTWTTVCSSLWDHKNICPVSNLKTQILKLFVF